MNKFYSPTWRYRFLLCLGLGLPLASQAQQEGTIAGTVATDAGTPLAGATIVIKSTYLGISTNEEGQFLLSNVQSQYPMVLLVGYVGYGTEEITLEQASSSLEVVLRPTKVLEQVIVAASRREESIGQVPVTVEKLDRRQLNQFTTPDFGSSLNRLKGVNVAGSGVLASNFSTRAFNSGIGTQVIQLADYMDTQLPTYSASIGNLFGTPVLDIASVEIVHGPASALYGVNAFNGVLLTNSRDPFLDPGLTVRLRGGSRSYFDGQFRYAQRIGKRAAFKISGGALSVDEFTAENQEATALVLEPQNNPANFRLGYNKVNQYGDLGFPSERGALAGQTIYLPGYTERELLGGDTQAYNYKVAPSLSLLLTNSVKATAEYRYMRASGAYADATRLQNLTVNQGRLQVEGGNWVVRAFSTNDNGNNTYSLPLLANRFVTRVLPGNITDPATGQPITYFGRYLGAFNSEYNRIFNGAGGGNADAAALAARTFANTNAPLPQAGTPEFESDRRQIIQDKSVSGAGSNARGTLNDVSGQYQVKNTFANLIVGAAYRQFRLRSDGSVYSDTNNESIINYQYGVYGEGSKLLLNNHLKLAVAARLDHFKNFGSALSPRVSAVYSAGADKNQNFRVSFGQANRSPTQLEQYAQRIVGPSLELGNVGSGLRGYVPSLGAAIRADNGLLNRPADLAAYEYNPAPLKLEKVQSLEAGYRAAIGQKLYLDVDYYYSFYDNFVTSQSLITNTDGSQPTTDQLRAAALTNFRSIQLPTRFVQFATNIDQRVESQGAGIGLSYVVAPALTLLGNYNFSDLRTKTFADNRPSEFNTPRHKYNLGLEGQALKSQLSYSVNYRWIDSFVYESSSAVGTIPVSRTVDAQLGYTIKGLRTTLQAGVTNLFDAENFQVYGAPQYGRLGYFGLLFDVK